jgi:lipoprotein-anchoring transpeptidase ErfK/SrfK
MRLVRPAGLGIGLLALALLPVAFLTVVPAARAARSDASCAVTATRSAGAAPLQVTYTAACTAASYMWNFGDGSQGQGQTISHSFAAGAFAPTLTTDAGVDSLPSVTSISVRLSGPRRIAYGGWLTLRAQATPALPVRVRGHPVVDGTVRLRALSTAPYVAVAEGVRSTPLQVLLTPKVVARLEGAPVVGGRVRVVASLHPAHAGTLRVTVDGRTGLRVATASPHIATATVAVVAGPGWAAPAPVTLHATVVRPDLAVGATGASVVALEQRLAALHFLVPHGRTFTAELTDGVYAFQKVQGLPRTGIADAATWQALASPRAPQPRNRSAGLHIEVSKALQVLLVVRDGTVAQIAPVSTAGLPGMFTPVGHFQVYRKVGGFDPSPLGVLWLPSYFTGGYAIHGAPSVPPYPASHGCIRVPMWIAPTLYAEMPLGTAVDVY